MKTKILFLVLAGMVTAGNIMGQITYASGAQTNNCATVAGVGGVNATFIGCGAGNQGGGDYNTFIGDQAGYNHKGGGKGPNDNVAVGHKSLFTQFNNGAGYSTFNVCIGNYSLYTNNPSAASSNGWKNTAIGYKAGYLNETGSYNTFSGFESGYTNTASENTFYGFQSGYTNSTATGNVFTGFKAGYTNNASNNTFTGYNAGTANNTGANNTFTGKDAGLSNNSGGSNTFMGYQAGKTNTAGDYLCAFGYTAGAANTTGDYNTFVGSYSGGLNNSGGWNTYLGFGSGNYTTTADSNVYIGHVAGWQNETGNGNTICGVAAGRGVSTNSYSYNSFFGFRSAYSISTGDSNTVIGAKAGYALTSGSRNTFLGYGADAGSGTLNNVTAIGYNAICASGNGDDQIQLGDATNDIVYCQAMAWGSDGRFKFNIQENVKGLEFINKLRPVTYQFDTKMLTEHVTKNMPDSIRANYVDNVDFTKSKNKIHSGFIAQEVEQAESELGFTSSIVVKPVDTTNGYYAISYYEIVVPLVKAVQEQQHLIDSLFAILAPKNERKANTGDNNETIEEIQNLQKRNAINIELKSEEKVILYQNIPNPFGEETTINYYLPETVQNAKMVFYDNTGRKINEVVLEQKGNASVIANSAKLSSGIYSYSIIVDGKVVDTLKMQRVK